MNRHLARAAAPIAALAVVVLAAAPASAHTGVSSQQAQALAVDAVLAFKAAGESDTAGIDEVQVVLPQGIGPADVSLVKAPQGWAFKPGQDGFTVSGPALAPGKAAEYQVKVRQLPDAPQLAFKTLVMYTDTQVDRWIEIPQNGSEPKNPAPVLKLAKAAPGATPLAAATPSPTPTPAPTPVTPAATPTPSVTLTAVRTTDESGGAGSNGPVIIGAVALLLVTVAGAVWWRRRSSEG
ncbi:DUF1775 domain-containing protein [Kitasatospora sp. NPDC051853]|uniref:DUF1775 domain-containing protein n=1 Tax=Kitasatospora sp. NPDC051853 TaxID=3364058 RepID=UPI0037B967F4